MSYDHLFEEVHRRRQVYKNLKKHLEHIKETLRNLDQDVEIYLFGSVADNTHTLSSDIDVLVIINSEPVKVHLVLWKNGIREPFEIHVHPPRKTQIFQEKSQSHKNELKTMCSEYSFGTFDATLRLDLL
jgi:predicted nucleotidyltransferase